MEPGWFFLGFFFFFLFVCFCFFLSGASARKRDIGQKWAQETDYQEMLRYREGDRALAQVAQRDCQVSSLEIFKNCLGTLLCVSLLEQGLGQGTSRGSFPASAIL